MALTNKWTNPLRRSFQDIKNDLLKALQNMKDSKGQPLITDVSEGNIFVIIISLFAAVAETLHFYIDNMARECFISTARKYSSVTKLGLLVDYHAHCANAASVDVVLTRELTGEITSGEIEIPEGTQFKDSQGNQWLSSKKVIWGAGTTSCTVPLIQHEVYNNSVLNGNLIDQLGFLAMDSAGLGGKLIEHGSINLKIGEDKWTQVDTFAYSKPTDKHFMVVVDESDIPFIKFGDGKFGSNPTIGSKIEVSYYITSGSAGNIPSNSITQVPSFITQIVQNATCNNPYPSGGGMDYEGIELLRSHIPLHARTMALAITKQDFIDCAKLVPGVKDVAMEYICGRKIDMYISPIVTENGVGGGIASSTLLNNVKDYLVSHAPMTTWLSVYPAGISNINLSLDVTGRPSFSSDQISTSILQALSNEYSASKAQIGGKVRISDIYALIDNLPEVDYLYIKKFYVSPWPKIVYGDRQLDLSITNINKAKGSMKYIISFTDTKSFTIYSSENGFQLQGQMVGNVNVIDNINGFNFSMTIAGSYGLGYKYEITISEPNHDYEEPGFNQVIFDPSKLTLNITETV